MKDEINIIRSNLHAALDDNSHNIQYILLPFNNPDVGPPLVSSTVENFMDNLDLVEVGGGQECPEKSLSAIEMALEKIKAPSYMYLFTDAIAKQEERNKIDFIAQLCRERQSQVFIFQSGQCPAESNNYYRDVAKLCGGSTYYFELYNLKKAFTFIKETMRLEWTPTNVEIESSDTFGLTHCSFTIDILTSNILIGVSGVNAEVEVLNDSGQPLPYERVMKTKDSAVVRIDELNTWSTYRLEVRADGLTDVYVFTHKQLSFQYGFSPKIPRSLQETSDRPLPGISSNILIEIQGNIELVTLEVTVTTGETISIKFDRVANGCYIAKHLFEPGKSFKLLVTGRDIINKFQVFNGGSDLIKTQEQGMITEWISPTVEIIDKNTNLIDYEMNATFACLVDSFPQPEVWWEDENLNRIPSDAVLLKLPSTYISYATIKNVSKNATIICKAKNPVNKAEDSLEVFVNRTFTFVVLQYPSDITVEYGDEGKLYCEVNAYPEAEIIWSHNGTEIDNNRVEINPDEHSLIIKEMDLIDAGEYVCDIHNGVESTSYTAIVYITGLDVPSVKLEKTEVILKPGDWTQQECTLLKGKPKPSISWKYRLENGYDFLDIPDGVYIEGSIMKISSAQSYHGGVYVCEANNSLGLDQREVLVKVQYTPRIRNQDESLVVRQGELVSLPCEVDAVPNAEVHWDMYQDDVIISFDDRHYTDGTNTHRFMAQLNDSGMYHCIAINSMGRAMRTVNVNVWVAPYIQAPVSKNITQKIGTTLYLDCYINFGNPVPSTRWEFIASNTNISVLTTGHATGKLDFTIQNLKKKHEGTYRCIAENEVGIDRINLFVKVV